MQVTPATALATVFGTLAYLGLAILDWGGFAAYFSHPSLTVLSIVVIILSAVALFTAGNRSPGEREDRSNRWVLRRDRSDGRLAAGLP
jgi:hypothetical protein